MRKSNLTVAGLSELLGSGDLKVSKASFEKIERSFKFLNDRVNRTGETIYGVNTG
ncbi:MAG: histidine ammonia-lyase, partial [Bacteroidia bacterium]